MYKYFLEIEEMFLDNLSKLAFSLLHPTKLVAKRQQDIYLTGEMLLEHFKVGKTTIVICRCCVVDNLPSPGIH